MKSGTRAVQHLSGEKHQEKEGSPDHRLVHTAYSGIQKKQNGIQTDTQPRAKAKKPEKQAEKANQNSHVKTADTKNVGNANIREDFTVFGRDQISRSKQQG